MFVVQVIAQQFKRHVLATVTHVLVLERHIAVQQVIAYVPATVTLVLVLVQHIAVQQVLAYVLVIVTHVLVLAQHIIVQPVTLYVQHAIIVLVLVPYLTVPQLLLEPQVMVVLLCTIAATATAFALRQKQIPAYKLAHVRMAKAPAPLYARPVVTRDAPTGLGPTAPLCGHAIKSVKLVSAGAGPIEENKVGYSIFQIFLAQPSTLGRN